MTRGHASSDRSGKGHCGTACSMSSFLNKCSAPLAPEDGIEHPPSRPWSSNDERLRCDDA
jgi:hypothetical protein